MKKTAEPKRRRTPITMYLVLIPVGGVIGAFILAPFVFWQVEFAQRCIGAAIGILMFAWPGTITLAVARRAVCSDRRKTPTDWSAVATVLILALVGAAIGAFVLAPYLWPERLDFALRCIGAAAGITLALFAGTVLVAIAQELIHAARRRRGASNAAAGVSR